MRQPIAVLGVGCRFPAADGVEQFWKLLCDEVDAIGEVPPDRWSVDALRGSGDAASGGVACCRWGGFVDRSDYFDAGLFDIGAPEAERMDPQQGMVLESAWQALEYAGLAPDGLRGSATGVFVGISNNDFDRKLCRDLRNLDLRAGTGTSYSMVANRLSYVLGLCGPSIAIDLACSSSLSAIHLACQSLWCGECDLALAGGVHLILSPEKTVTFSRGRVLSQDGRCKSFSARADGYVRGEGCGIVVLKRFDDARRDGDPVFALIRGSAVNHNGPSNGLSAPTGMAQQRLIRQALSVAGLSAYEVGYVEAHGTGSSLGDLIEINALKAALCAGRPPYAPCLVGSVKSNIGHLEAAAGVASLIKAMLVVREGWIPRTLHAEPENPDFRLERAALKIASRAQAWPQGTGPRRASVSSLSFGGANAHAIVEEPPRASRRDVAPMRDSLLTFSARTAPALLQLAERYARYCTHLASLTDGQERFADACFTAAVGRKHFPWRHAVVACHPAEAARSLESLLDPADPWVPTVARRRRKLTVTFVFAAGCHFEAALTSVMHLEQAGITPDVIRGLDPEGERMARDISDSVRIAVSRRGDLQAGDRPPSGGLTITFGAVPDGPVEVGSRPVRLSARRDAAADEWVAAIAAAYVAGINPQWRLLFDGRSRIGGLPTYPFERQCYWRTLEPVAPRPNIEFLQ